MTRRSIIFFIVRSALILLVIYAFDAYKAGHISLLLAVFSIIPFGLSMYIEGHLDGESGQ